MPARWYVAKIHRWQEGALRDQLAPMGLDTYSPEIIVNKAGRRRVEVLFPTYLFCKGDLAQDIWSRLRYARGLKYFLGSDHGPAPVDDGIIETIRRRVEEWNHGGWKEAFKPGERVVITSGPFKGLEAIFVRYVPARERCRILLATVSLRHEVELDAALLASASRAHHINAR